MAPANRSSITEQAKALAGELSKIVKKLEEQDKLIGELNKLLLEAQGHFSKNETQKAMTCLSLAVLNLNKISNTYSMLGILQQMSLGRPNIDF